MASLPYPRRPLDNSPTDGTDAHRWFGCVGFSHRIHRCSQIRRVWHPCHTHATLCQSSHGIHRIHRNFWRKIFSHRFHRCSQIRRVWHLAIPTPPSANPPTEFTEFTEASNVEEPPTDFTDAHRWLGCVGFSHRIHRIHGSFWQRIFSHRFHRCTQMVRFCGFCGKIV